MKLKIKTEVCGWKDALHLRGWCWILCSWAAGFGDTHIYIYFVLFFFLQQIEQHFFFPRVISALSLLLFFPSHIDFFWLYFSLRYWWISFSSCRSKRGSNGLDYDSERWLRGHCLDLASWELPQPLPALVFLLHPSPLRHHPSEGPSFLMENRYRI